MLWSSPTHQTPAPTETSLLEAAPAPHQAGLVCSPGRCGSCEDPCAEWEGSTLPGQGLHGSRYTRSLSTLTWWSVFSLQESPLLRHPWYPYVVPRPPRQRQHCSSPPHWLHHLHISMHARSCSPPPKASPASLPLLHIHSPPILPSVLTSRVLPEASPAPFSVCML